MTRSNIEAIVNQVLIKYVSRGGAYKQFDKICQSENIKYKEIDVDESKFAGVFTKALNEQKYIMINSNIDNFGRKNFTKAHELGHYFLGHQLNGHTDTSINEECSSKEPIEYEADYFATCLLMPKEKVIKAFKSLIYNLKNIKNKNFIIINKENYGIWCYIRDKLTKRYGVSETALRYRLINLGLLKFDMQYFCYKKFEFNSK